MDADRVGRVVAELRARDVMAHPDRTGVYECGIRVVLDTNIEALWDMDGAAGLDAEIVSDGVLIGFVPRVPGSADFSDEQIVDHIATARYTLEGLHPPANRTGDGEAPAADARPTPPPPEAGTPPPRHRRWRGRLRHRGRQPR